ncbi:GNAT family N-acetyltransferase [Streptomyces sp. B1866]|uniref:GNAT family N-acetyltransferase n=1 Tax=Streptomyces sp. B1866 TaxID=3075431 RepID=UPI0028908634|nr:GNAT family N-acetyltransferase [Streptomyces sp. B1866]MDT3399302.1 GNAT family N-acetyltransferase [Streptomyces sp. B1866]
MHTITRLSADTFRDSVKGLADLLAGTVADGGSVGFLAPFDQGAAAAWWRGRQAAVDDGSLTMWAAHGPGGLTGTVGLARGAMPAGRRRAEIVKLMVHPDARGQGLGRALLATAEEAAVRAGLTLLHLDTEAGTPAERLYLTAGWTRYGIVPGYANNPAGVPKDCSFFFKRLG